MLKKSIASALLLSLALGASAASAPPRPLLDDCATAGKDGSPANLSGTVNTYWPPTTNLAAGATQMTVGPASGATVTFPSITTGDLLLVIQMQDAAIDANNDERYGDGTGTAGNTTGNGSGSTNLATTGNAGYYEYVQVTSTNPPGGVLTGAGGTINFEGRNGVGLLHSYANANSTAAAGQKRFQVIRVPQYDTVTLSNATPVTCAAWDGEKGGIVVMDVKNTINFNGGSVNVNGLGFRGGGGVRQTGGSGANTDYRTVTQVGGGSGTKCNGSKGEGYAGTPRLIYDGTAVVDLTATDTGYPSGSNARGAPGNAGGGATDGDPGSMDNNAGGGGGGNGGAGGKGGDSGIVRVASGGFGGAAFPYAASRVVMGGGGGAGSNKATPEGNAAASSGGRGGGIVMIRAFDVSANLGTVSANGAIGSAPQATNGNGGGGGGAGGSILFTILSGNLSSLTLTANGGAGTNATFNQANKFGPGGGGAGGVILTSALAGTVSATAGAAGLTGTPPENYGATVGSTGVKTGGAPGDPALILPTDIPGVLSGAECSTLFIDDVTVTEGNAGTVSAVFTVQNPSGSAATINFTTNDGTATTANNDYQANSGQLVFAPGELSKTITVLVNGDTTSEPDETFTVTITPQGFGVRIGKGTGTGTIRNDDGALSINNVSQAEGNAGTSTFGFTVTLAHASTQTVSVDFTTVNGTATTADSDYAATNGTLTFNPGETSKPVNVTVNGDTNVEPNEAFTVVLSNAVNSAITTATGTGTILNDDSNISINNVSAAEGNAGTTNFTFTVSLDVANANTVTVNYATADGTATTAGNDYTAKSGTVTFNPGETSQQVVIAVNGDTTPEADETFTVVLSGPVNGAISGGTGTGTIQNDDAGISINDVTLAEGDAGTTAFTFTVSLDFASVTTVTVNYATADGTATVADNDYAAATGTVTFNPGVTSQTVTVLVNGDAKNEADETFTVVLSGPTNGAIVDGTGLGTITNDDPVPTVSIGNVTGAEGNAGTTSFLFDVTLSAASGQTVTVDFATANGTATGGDFTAATGTVTFNPGETAKQITVLVTGDTTPEPDETFTVTLSNPANATVAPGLGTGTGTIRNDDSGISINDVPLAEGNAGTTSFTFTVSLDFANVNTITVNFATADGTATVADGDYAAATGTVTFNPGQTSQTITVLVTGDAKNEANETFTITLSGPTNGAIVDGTGLGTINNDDAVPTLSINDVTAAEGNAGAASFTFNVTLSAASGQTVTVDFATADGTATTADGDYAATNGTLTFNPGVTTQTVTVAVTGDVRNEIDETFFVNLTNPGNATIADNQGLGTITNDDPLPTLSIDDVAVNEGNSGTTAFTFTITLSGASGQTVTVDFATANGTATLADNDYASTTGTRTFNPGETTKTVTVLVNGDTTDEANETFFVNLSNPSLATIADGQGQGTIQNDDSAPTVSIGNGSVVEGNSGTTTITFTATLSAASGQTVTVNFATADGTATVADNDYVASSGTLTFAPGVMTQPVVVTVNGDTNDEPTETFSVVLSNPNGATLGTATGTGTIATDDTPADLRVVKTVDNANPGAGDTITYTMTISYIGPTDATNVTLIDHLPADLSFNSATPSQGTFDQASGVWSVGTLITGSSATLTISATVNAGTWGKTIVNSVTIGSDVQNDVNPTNNSSSVSIVVGIPPLVIEFAGAAAGVAGVDPVVAVLPQGTEGAFYQQQAFATGGLPQFHWAVASSSPAFPFNLDPDTGVFSGITAAGTYSFRLAVSDAQNPAASDVRDFTVTINAPGGSPLINIAPAPPSGIVGTFYSHPFTAAGGTPPYSWSVSAGLPPGLLLQASTGIVAGTPTLAGSYNFTVTVTDSALATDSKLFTIDIVPLSVAIVTTTLPPGSEGSVYSQQIGAQGGIGPTFTWTLASGTLPPGTSLSGTSRTAVLSGTPIAQGTYVFTVEASDDSQPGVSDTQVLIVLISGAGTQPLITTSSIPEGTVTIPYSAQLTAAGGLTPYAWSLVAGSLPGGLTLDPVTGLISGSPTEAGIFQIIVQVADSTNPHQSDTQELTLTVWTLPTIVTPALLPNGLPGVPYSSFLSAIGGKAPLSWSLISGAPPAGITFAPASGAVHGTPAAPVTNLFTARITDENGNFDERTFTVTILDPSSLAIVTNSLGRGIVGIPYSRRIIAVGGTTPYTWSSTALPGGLTLDPATGILSGTPTAAGTTTVTFTVTDALSAIATRDIDVVIENPLQITTVRLPDGNPRAAYSTGLAASGGTGPNAWEILDATLPPGLSLSASTGAITGVPPQEGVWTFLAQVRDSDGHTSQKVFSIFIHPFSTQSFKAGYCGLTGLEILVPLGALWLYRRRRSARKTGAVLAALLAIGVAAATPASADEDRWIEGYRTLSLQEPPAAPKPETRPSAPAAPQGDGEPFAEKFEVGAHIGLIAFSSEFEADPEFAAGINARAALPWFSKDVLGLDTARFGLFADFTFSSISRDIPTLKETDGTLIFFTVGLDITAYQDDSFVLRPQLGLQYGHFGGVTDLDNGIALLLGVHVGVNISEQFRIFFNPQVGIGDDMVFFLPLGVSYSF